MSVICRESENIRPRFLRMKNLNCQMTWTISGSAIAKLTLTITSIHALSYEEKFLLSKTRPSTLGAAKRIQGITPVAAFALIRHTQKAKMLSELETNAPEVGV